MKTRALTTFALALVPAALSAPTSAQEGERQEAPLHDLARVRAAFAAADADGDGTISPREAALVGHRPEDFRAFDADSSGGIDAGEFVQGYGAWAEARGLRVAPDVDAEAGRLRQAARRRADEAQEQDVREQAERAAAAREGAEGAGEAARVEGARAEAERIEAARPAGPAAARRAAGEPADGARLTPLESVRRAMREGRTAETVPPGLRERLADRYRSVDPAGRDQRGAGTDPAAERLRAAADTGDLEPELVERQRQAESGTSAAERVRAADPEALTPGLSERLRAAQSEAARRRADALPSTERLMRSIRDRRGQAEVLQRGDPRVRQAPEGRPVTRQPLRRTGGSDQRVGSQPPSRSSGGATRGGVRSRDG